MACPLRSQSACFGCVFALLLLLAAYPSVAADDDSVLTLVRVNIIVEKQGVKDAVEINGKLVADYSPTIIQDFPSTGIVFDDRNHILTFLGYRWVDIHNSNARILITPEKGRKWKGKLIGIDQSNGVAVIKLLEGSLKKTPVCAHCELKDGAVVMAPVMEATNKAEFRQAQILSVGTGLGSLDPGAWTMTLNRPLPDIGLPVLTPDYRVLGFIVSQDPLDMHTVVHPISQLLASAQKILKAGGDIRTGWLGIYLDVSNPAEMSGVKILRVEEGSPAQKAGLIAGDVILKLDGRDIKNAMQFIQLVQNTPVGSRVNLDLVRQGLLKSKSALVESRKFPRQRSRLSFNLTGSFDFEGRGIFPELSPPNPRLLMGLSTEMLTPPLAEALQMPGRTGLLVLGVAPNMPAERAGVRVGDLIVSIDGQPILDPSGFASFLQTHAWGTQSVLNVLRKGTEVTILVQLHN
ncbi:MAG: PDZ domain-containing protein [Acidobacteriota bacterium]|nr:PDZ domain-containing protein [Acidobacteriota bacterium]